MKTPLLLLKLAALVWLLAPASASAFYNPQAGRWLNRDPIGEWGGFNTYAFVENDPLGRTDADGRWWWLAIPLLLTGCSSSCTCESVSVSFDDGTSSVNWHWVREGKSIRFGSTMKVEWKVSGNPSKCKYFQREKGNFIWFRSRRDPRAKSARWSDHEVSRNYTDYIGGYFYSPADDGTWQTLTFQDPSIVLECQSSNGGKIAQSVSVQTPPDPGLFPPQK